MRAVAVHRHGGPEVLTPTEWATPAVGPGDVLVDVAAIGVNYHETYERSGLYPRELPYVPGRELAGTVAAVGHQVTGIEVGDLVATADVPAPGAYAEQVALPADRVVRVPDGVSAEQAAAVLLQGLTAHVLTQDSHPVRPGETALVHAAAGGVGLLLTQVLRTHGVRVIGTVSTAAKEEAARRAGADEVIRYTEVDFATEVARLTGGDGVDVVYDAVGRTTFEGSVASLRPRGSFVLYGQSSGKIPPLDLSTGVRGSIKLTRPYLPDFIPTRDELRTRGTAVFSWILRDNVDVHIGRIYPLADARTAQADLQQRRTIGKLLLTP
ncbi:alcohol dehydrogenase [Streptomyces longispororuber]|uniref:Alcohol dehydrogenase n=1 Tax=Streptomyces longispororuber TaxID=68230 RepID=A0A919DTJ4_9ACTN|nr:quinone oxidoreductase [Streptomyces longispororuber]GHE79562.1 alcohol dehydrogenase [Streptomyces longispororuber]